MDCSVLFELLSRLCWNQIFKYDSMKLAFFYIMSAETINTAGCCSQHGEQPTCSILTMPGVLDEHSPAGTLRT